MRGEGGDNMSLKNRRGVGMCGEGEKRGGVSKEEGAKREEAGGMLVSCSSHFPKESRGPFMPPLSS